MKKYFIDNFVNKKGEERFCVKTKNGNVFLDANGAGYKTERKAHCHLLSKICEFVRYKKYKQFMEIILGKKEIKSYTEEEKRVHFVNLLNMYWGKDGRRFKKKDVEKALEKSGFEMQLTVQEFFNRFRIYKTEGHLYY